MLLCMCFSSSFYILSQQRQQTKHTGHGFLEGDAHSRPSASDELRYAQRKSRAATVKPSEAGDIIETEVDANATEVRAESERNPGPSPAVACAALEQGCALAE